MQNRQPELYCAALIPYTAAAVALVLRILARFKTNVGLKWEDYLSMTAFAIGTGFTFISVYKMRWGLGMRLADIDMPVEQITRHYFLDLWADMWLYTFSVGLSKFVILGFFWRTFKFSIIRQPIRILMVCSACWIIVRVSVILAQCQPVHKFWDKDAPGKCPITASTSLFAVNVPHFVIEVAIFLCPMVEIRRLQLPRAQKVAVGAMFLSGILVCMSTLGTIIHTLLLDTKSSDLTWDGLDDQIWAVCDVNLAHFSTSLPLLRPVFKSIFGYVSTAASTTFRSRSNSITHGLSRARTHRRFETDSMHQLADGRESLHSSDVRETTPNGGVSTRVVALQDLRKESLDIDTRDAIFVKNEMSVKVSRA